MALQISLQPNQKVWLIHAGVHEAGEHGKFWQSYMTENYVAIDGAISDVRAFEHHEQIDDELLRIGDLDF